MAVHIVSIRIGHDQPDVFVCINPSQYLQNKFKTKLEPPQVRGLLQDMFEYMRKDSNKFKLLHDQSGQLEGPVVFHSYQD